MRVYRKLVRDRIPEIINDEGNTAITRTLCDDEYSKELNNKLNEEVQEFLSDGSVEELADIYEVLLAILESKHIPYRQFEEVRNKKALERGRFSQRLFLEAVKENRKEE